MPTPVGDRRHIDGGPSFCVAPGCTGQVLKISQKGDIKKTVSETLYLLKLDIIKWGDDIFVAQTCSN